MSDLADRIAQEAFVVSEAEAFNFAGGDTANNKLDIEKITGDLFDDVSDELTVVAEDFDPDLAMYVPNGAKPFSEAVGRKIGVVVAKASKLPGPERKIVIPSRLDKTLIHTAERIVIFEDVTSKFTSICKLLGALAGEGIDVEERVSGIVAIWRRGTPKTELDIPGDIPVRWLVEEPMPTKMTPKQIEKFRKKHGILQK